MAYVDATRAHTVPPSTWTWWERRRVGYNAALALAGWAAYGLMVATAFAFHKPIWPTWEAAVSNTIAMGTGFLVVMGFANICYLLGAWTESWLKPDDVETFRKSAFGLGFWGSVAMPFLLPLLNFAFMIGGV